MAAQLLAAAELHPSDDGRRGAPALLQRQRRRSRSSVAGGRVSHGLTSSVLVTLRSTGRPALLLPSVRPRPRSRPAGSRPTVVSCAPAPSLVRIAETGARSAGAGVPAQRDGRPGAGTLTGRCGAATPPAASRSHMSPVTPRSRSTDLRTLPFSVSGSASTKSQVARDREVGEPRLAVADQRRPGRARAPSRRTTPPAPRPRPARRRTGNDRDGARRRDGSSSACSTSQDEMFSPRRRIASLRRSRKRNQPSASRTARSPVWNHRLRQVSTVFSGIAEVAGREGERRASARSTSSPAVAVGHLLVVARRRPAPRSPRSTRPIQPGRCSRQRAPIARSSRSSRSPRRAARRSARGRASYRAAGVAGASATRTRCARSGGRRRRAT